MTLSALTKAARISAALAASTTGLGLAAIATSGSVHADPIGATAKVGVGSDTIQDLVDAYAGAEPFTGPNAAFLTPLASGPATSNVTISSWDAIPFGGSPAAPGVITTRAGGPAFDRPNGSSNGVQALRASNGLGSNPAGGQFWQAGTASGSAGPVNVAGQIDFARASRGPNIAGNTLDFIPFARDGVTYVFVKPAGDSTDISQLTTPQLKSVYSDPNAAATVGSEKVKGCLPQSGSGTRAFFEGAIGVPEVTAGPEAVAAGCNALEENNGNTFFNFATTNSTAGTAYVIPFSAGSYIAQANGASTDNSATARASSTFGVGNPDGTTTGNGGPITGTAPTLAPNPAYYQSSQYGRDLFVVVPAAKASGINRDKALSALFAGSTSAVCSSAAQATANKFGFASLNGNDFTTNTSGTSVALLCGDVTDQASN